MNAQHRGSRGDLGQDGMGYNIPRQATWALTIPWAEPCTLLQERNPNLILCAEMYQKTWVQHIIKLFKEKVMKIHLQFVLEEVRWHVLTLQ